MAWLIRHHLSRCQKHGSSGNVCVCGFPCLSRLIWHLKVPPLTKYVVVSNFFRGGWSGILLFIQGVCVISVCGVSVHAFFYETLNMSEVFSFLDRDPLDRHCLVHLTHVTQLLPFGCWFNIGWFNDFWGFTYEPSLYSERKVFVSTEDPKVIEKAGQLTFSLDESSFFFGGWKEGSRWV